MNDTLEAPAATIGELLLDRSPEFVSEETLCEATGLSGYAVRWYIFQLRRAHFVIEAAVTADRAAFAQGVRGWRLVDVATPPVPANVPAPPLETETSVTVSHTLRPIRKGARVRHAVHGEGRVAFWREGFPKVAVTFAHGSEKVSPAELATL